MSPSHQNSAPDHDSAASSGHRRANVRISHTYSNKEYVYRPNSVGRLIIGDLTSNANKYSHVVTVNTDDADTPTPPMSMHSKLSGDYELAQTKCTCQFVGDMILRILDYYIHGMIMILISFRLEDISSAFSVWFWRYRVIFNILLMSMISVFGYLTIHCPYICFNEQPYAYSFIMPIADDHFIGFILFVYCWVCCLLLPMIFVYLATGKIRTNRYLPTNLDDVMINGDIIGIFELEMFGIFESHTNREELKKNVYTLTACNINWSELESQVLMQYLYILRNVEVNFDEIYDPYDADRNLLTQLCRNKNDCYQWIEVKEIRKMLMESSAAVLCVASCCSVGNFRIFKCITNHFGKEFLETNSSLALNYALRCRGSMLQQKQANRIIVYVVKNTSLNIKDFVSSFGEDERKMILKLFKSKYLDIEQLQNRLSDVPEANEAVKPTKRISKMDLIGMTDVGRAELLQSQLSNNSINEMIIKKDRDEPEESEKSQEHHA